MKKLFLALLCLVFVSIVYADIDTFEGTATSTTDTYEGNTNTDTIEGQAIASGGSGPTLTAFIAGSEDNGDPLSTGTGNVNTYNLTHEADHNSSANGAFTVPAATAAAGLIGYTDNIDYASGKISFYFKPSVTPADSTYFFADSASYSNFMTRISGTTIQMRVNGTSVDFTTYTSASFTVGTWYLIVFTWDDTANEVTMQVDGGTIDTKACVFSGVGSVGSFILFNRHNTLTNSMAGAFDTISIYDGP